MRKKIWFICLALFITMIFTSCNATNANSKGKIKLGVTSWKKILQLQTCGKFY
ncbi:hypothetical protein ACT7DF_07250 [Bacillus cereus]